MSAYRSHTCGELTAASAGAEVRLSGWVHRVRDHGGVLFIDLRDHYGITQVIADSDSPAFAALEKLRAEGIIEILYLTVRADNIAAIRLYERCGFEKLARLERDTQIGDKYYDAVLMRRFIEKAEATSVAP